MKAIAFTIPIILPINSCNWATNSYLLHIANRFFDFVAAAHLVAVVSVQENFYFLLQIIIDADSSVSFVNHELLYTILIYQLTILCESLNLLD